VAEKASAGAGDQALLLNSSGEEGDEYGLVSGNGGTATSRQALALLCREVEVLRTEIADLRDNLASRPVVRHMMLSGLGSEQYHLARPIWVLTEEYDDGVTARFVEVEATGHGDTEPEALAALQLDIIALHEELRRTPADELGKLPRSWQSTLADLVIQVADHGGTDSARCGAAAGCKDAAA
jgi:hypothetical protein